MSMRKLSLIAVLIVASSLFLFLQLTILMQTGNSSTFSMFWWTDLHRCLYGWPSTACLHVYNSLSTSSASCPFSLEVHGQTDPVDFVITETSLPEKNIESRTHPSWSTQLASAKWFVCFFVFRIYVVCDFEGEDSLKNLHILSSFVWLNSFLFLIFSLCFWSFFPDSRQSTLFQIKKKSLPQFLLLCRV